MRQSSSGNRASRPSRRRQARGARANRACVSCKEKKLKCDDNTPTCANCHRFGSACLVEDPETKKQRPRNYLEALEERLALLEHRESEPPHPASSVTPGSGISRPALPGSHGSSKSWPAFTSEAGDGTSNDLPSKIGLLDVQSTQVEPQYLGSSSAFAFAHLISSSLRGAIAQKPTLGRIAGDTTGKATPMPCPLPEYSVAVALCNAYFENIHPQYPFLDERAFRHHQEILLGPSSDVEDFGLYSVPLFFINMVYAVGSLLLPGYQHLAEQFYISAQLYPQVLSHDNLEAIQAVLSYAMYTLRSTNGPSLWKLSGLALRHCIELGYHRSTKRIGSNLNPFQVELRKRVFWCAQGIDCACAMRLGRPLGIQLQEVDVPLPLDLDDGHITHSTAHDSCQSPSPRPPTSMSNAIHVIRLRCIWARIHSSVYSAPALGGMDDETRDAYIRQLRADLDQWRATAPEPPPRSGTTLSIFSTRVWYDLNYSGTILHMYRVQLAEGKQTPDHVFIDCMQAASTVCQLYRRQYVGTAINHTWGTLHCLFLAGLTYLHCLWTSPTARASVQYHEVSKTCTDCTMVLVVIAQEWGATAPYRDIFEVLASRTTAMIVNQSYQHHPPPATPALSSVSERDAVTRWMADIDDMGMLDVFDSLLSGFVDDVTQYQLDGNAL